MDNYLEFYKEHSDDPYFVAERGQDKIFAHRLCADAEVSRKFYSMRSVNAAFENNTSEEQLLGKMIGLIHNLQTGLDTRFVNHPFSTYEQVSEDYPALYEKILTHISEKALDTMAAHKQDHGTKIYPANLGEQVAHRIRQDRERWLGQNNQPVAPGKPASPKGR